MTGATAHVTFGPPVAMLAGGSLDPFAIGVGILMSLLGGGLIGVVLKHTHDRKKLPIEREAMLATASSETVASVLTALRDAERRLGKVERRQVRTERKLTRLQRAYQSLLSWALHLVENWEQLRERMSPPPIPVLALLDLDDLHADEAEAEADVEGGG